MKTHDENMKTIAELEAQIKYLRDRLKDVEEQRRESDRIEEEAIENGSCSYCGSSL